MRRILEQTPCTEALGEQAPPVPPGRRHDIALGRVLEQTLLRRAGG